MTVRFLKRLAIAATSLVVAAGLAILESDLALRHWRSSVFSTADSLRTHFEAARISPLKLLESPDSIFIERDGGVILVYSPPWVAWLTRLNESLFRDSRLGIRIDPENPVQSQRVKVIESSD